MQLKAEEPARRAFAEIGAVIAQQDDPAVANWPADRDGLGVEQVIITWPTLGGRAGDEDLTDLGGEFVQAGEPLLIRKQMRESPRVIGTDQQVSAFESWGLQITLHQGDGEDFSIGERSLRMIRLPPVGRLWMMGEEIGKDDIESG